MRLYLPQLEVLAQAARQPDVDHVTVIHQDAQQRVQCQVHRRSGGAHPQVLVDVAGGVTPAFVEILR